MRSLPPTLHLDAVLFIFRAPRQERLITGWVSVVFGPVTGAVRR